MFFACIFAVLTSLFSLPFLSLPLSYYPVAVVMSLSWQVSPQLNAEACLALPFAQVGSVLGLRSDCRIARLRCFASISMDLYQMNGNIDVHVPVTWPLAAAPHRKGDADIMEELSGRNGEGVSLPHGPLQL